MTKILLIEDDINLRDGLTDLLEINGFQVTTAADGIEGLKLAREILPGLIICDIMMPKLDGYGLKELINHESKLSAIPFIFLTAKAEMKSFREGMDLGADDYIIKPFDMSQLLKVIHRRLERHREIAGGVPRIGEQEDDRSTKIFTAEDKLFINLSNKAPKVIKISDIQVIEAEGSYSRIYLNRNGSFLYRKSLNAWEKSLDKSSFIRIHRSIIINLNFIEKMSKWTSGTYLVHICGIEKSFNISQRYASQIRSQLKL